MLSRHLLPRAHHVAVIVASYAWKGAADDDDAIGSCPDVFSSWVRTPVSLTAHALIPRARVLRQVWMVPASHQLGCCFARLWQY